MKASTAVVCILLAWIVGMVVGICVVRWQLDGAVKRWEQERDSLQLLEERRQVQMLERERLVRVLGEQLKDEQARSADWERRYAHAKAARPALPALPDTGLVSAASVQQLVGEIATAHEAHVAELVAAADSTITSKDRVIAKYDTLLVLRTQDFVAERVARQHWEHLAKTAPVRRSRPTLFGIPLPRLQATCGVAAVRSVQDRRLHGDCTVGVGYAL